jgi:hypothetical protein
MSSTSRGFAPPFARRTWRQRYVAQISAPTDPRTAARLYAVLVEPAIEI